MKRTIVKKRVLAAVLCWMLIACLAAPTALAAQTQPNEQEAESSTTRFARILIYEVDLSISSAGLTTSYSRVKLLHSTDTLALTIELQRQNGSKWDLVNSWSTTGSGTVSIEKGWYVSSGTYRMQATAKVYNSSGTLVETAIATTGNVSY